VDQEEGAVTSTGLGRVASFYYLRHATAAELGEALRGKSLGVLEVLQALCATSEYDEIPVGAGAAAAWLHVRAAAGAAAAWLRVSC
jgi:hypothetical protein